MHNIWALMGLHECYERMEMQVDARRIKPRLDFSLARPDMEINASCFCRLSKCCVESGTVETTKS